MTGPIRSAVRPFFAALVFGVAALAAAATEPELSELSIVTASGTQLSYAVEIADTPDERRVGLMHRLKLAPDRGMLLWYPEPVEVRVWMKNTYVPLDILFIDEAGKVTGIAEGEPLSETLLPSNGPVRAVLELNAGQSAAQGITPGAVVQLPSAGAP